MTADRKTQLIFDHDGGIDDLLSLILLLKMPHIDLLTVTITPADCFASDALTSTLKLLHFYKRTNVPVAVGNIYGQHSFPPDWRAQPKIANMLPVMLRVKEDRQPFQPVPAHELMAKILKDAAEPIAVLMTGPCTNLATTLTRHPELKQKVSQVIWMGGAIDTQGNVSTYNHNRSAEWNVFWDPASSKALIEMELPLLLVALDATNKVPVNIEFLQQLAQLETPTANLAGQLWATTINTIPGYEYHMWDVLATSYFANPAAITFEPAQISVSTQEPNTGQTYRDDINGSKVSVAKDVDLSGFYDKLLELLR